MAEIIEISDFTDERVAPFCNLTDRQLRYHQDLLIAESPKVINVALDAGLEATALLCERKHIDGDASRIISRCSSTMPVYTGEREVLEQITGYKLTRGVLCAMRRPQEHTMADLLKGAQRVCVIHGVCDTTNIGTIFRSAAALGIDAVLLSKDSCDPFNRRSIRTSMGSVFLIPWGWVECGKRGVMDIESYGFKTAAMALCRDSIGIDDYQLESIDKLAIIVGTEGEGLPDDVIYNSSYRVKIPMWHGVDSLNVSTAAGIAFWVMSKKTHTSGNM